MAADQRPERAGAEQDRPAGTEQFHPREGDAVTWMLAVVAGATGALVAAGLGSAATDGRRTGTTAALGGVLAFVMVMSLRRWGSRTWLCLWLLAFGAYFSTLGMAGWARLGYVVIVTGLLLSAAFDATPRTLRATAGAALIVTAVLLMRIGMESTDDASTDMFGAVDAGAEALVSDAASQMVAGDMDIELGLVEWVVLAVLLGLAYRMLEIASGGRLVGPVTVEDTVVLGDPQAAGHRAGQTVSPLMRNWLAKADVAAPTAVPGASTAQSVVDIASADPLTSAGAVATAVAAAGRILFPPTGVVATPTYELRHPGPDHRSEHALTVTLQDARSRRLRAARTFTRADPDEVIGCASAFVAQHAMSQACTMPPWADWPDVGGDALVWYEQARAEDDQSLKQTMLARALAAHPSSGVLKVELGNALLLDGGSKTLLVALRHYLEARLAYPRFVLARYRLAAALAMLSDRGATAWRADPRQGPLADLDDLAHLLVQARLVDEKDVPLLAGQQQGGAATVLVDAARREVEAASRRVSLPWLAWSALVRPREREANLRLLLSTDEHRRVRLGIRTSAWLVDVRRLRITKPPDAAKRVDDLTHRVEKTVARARRWTPVGSTALYNAACFYALKSEPDTPTASARDRPDVDVRRAQDKHRAVDLLNEIRRAFPNRVLTEAWLEHDPDLRSLQGMEAFESLKMRVGEDEQRASAGRSSLPPDVLRRVELAEDGGTEQPGRADDGAGAPV
jgi:hypothetical protein